MSLCSIPARMSRDGFGGPNAKIYLPFLTNLANYGSTGGLYWFDGSIHNFPNATVGQDTKRFIGGITRPDTFQKGFAGEC
jgi:hypothetical protein